MTSTESVPAGWKPDPETGGTRYWDGRRWTGDSRPARQSFAAQSAHLGWAIALLAVGGLSALGSPSNFFPRTAVDRATGIETTTTAGPGAFVISLIFGLACLAFGLYLLRGKGPTTKAVEAKARAANDFEAAIAQLTAEVAAGPAPRAALVTAYMTAQAVSIRRFGAAAAPAEFAQASAAAGVTTAMISSPVLGQLPGFSVHRDWIIEGTRATDMTATARAQFHLDDRVQTVTTSQAKGKKVVSTSTEVPRGGVLQVVMADGVRNIRVAPNLVANARQLAEQINARADELRHAETTAASNRSSREAEQIRAISNPETAKALQNLQDLLFTRVITDAEFEQMKAKLFANPDPVN